MGNTILTKLSLQYAALEQGIETRYTSIVEGDDSIIGLREDIDIAKFEATLMRLGLKTTISVKEELAGCTFCKQLIVKDKGGKYGWYRNPKHALFKLGWSDKNRGKPYSKGAELYLCAKINSLKHEYRGIDLMQKLFNTILDKMTYKTDKLCFDRYQTEMVSDEAANFEFENHFKEDMIRMIDIIEEKGYLIKMNGAQFPKIFEGEISTTPATVDNVVVTH